MQEKVEEYFNTIKSCSIAKLIRLSGWKNLLEQIEKVYQLSILESVIERNGSIILIFEDQQDNFSIKRVIKVKLSTKKTQIENQQIIGEKKIQEIPKYFYDYLSSCHLSVNDYNIVLYEYQYYKNTLKNYLNDQRTNKKDVSEDFKRIYIDQMCEAYEYLRNLKQPIPEYYPSNVKLTVNDDFLIQLHPKIELENQKFYQYPQDNKQENNQFLFFLAITILMLDNIKTFKIEECNASQRQQIFFQLRKGMKPQFLKVNENSNYYQISKNLIGLIGSNQQGSIKSIKNLQIDLNQKIQHESQPLFSKSNNNSQKTLPTISKEVITLNQKVEKQQETTVVKDNEDNGYFKNSNSSFIKSKRDSSQKVLHTLQLTFNLKSQDKKLCFLELSPNEEINTICQILAIQKELTTFSLNTNKPYIQSTHIEQIIRTINNNNKILNNIYFNFENAYSLDKDIFCSLIKVKDQINKLKLYAKDSYFTYQDMKYLQGVLQFMKNLTVLELDFSSSVQICELGMQEIINGLQKCSQNLRELTLNFSQNNNMIESAFEQFNISTNLMSKLSKIHLNFSSNVHFGSKFLQQISSCILSNKQLQEFYLNLNSNELVQDQGFFELLEKLCQCNQLQIVEIHLEKNNKITDFPFNQLANLQSKLKIFKINLQNNQIITDRTLNSIGQMVKKQLQLQTLSLNFANNNNFTNEGITNLSQSLSDISEKISSLLNVSLNFRNCQKAENQWLSILLENMKSCNKLQALDLDLNFKEDILNNEKFQTIKEGLMNLNQLTELKLSFEKGSFMSDPFKDIFLGLKDNINLQGISFNFRESQQFDDQTLSYIGSIIELMKKPRKIELIFSNSRDFTDEGMNHLFDKFQEENSSLQKLNIDFAQANQITNKGLNYILQKMEKQFDLKEMNLNFNKNNNFTDAMLKDMLISFSKITNFSDISLLFSKSNFTSLGIEHLSLFLQSQRNLIRLNLDFSAQMSIHQNSYIYLEKSFAKNCNLSHLSLNLSEQYELNDIGFASICRGIRKCSSIQKLLLNLERNNLITNKSMKNLSQALQKCKYLRDFRLYLNRNDIIDVEGITALSKGIKNAIYLTYLEIQMNFNTKIRGEGIAFLAKAIRDKKQLKQLVLNFNGIKGFLSQISKLFSKCIETLESLQILNLQFKSMESIENTFLSDLKIGLQNCRLQKEILLDFSNSRIDQTGLQNFSEVFKSTKSITKISLFCPGNADQMQYTHNFLKSSFINSNRQIQIQINNQTQSGNQN